VKFHAWILAFLIASCCSSKQSAADYGAGAYSLTGTMKHIPLEGGCWQFTAGDGSTYQLAGERAATLLVDGLRAEIIVKDLPERHTICMTGKSVEVLTIIKTY
jgi:hypothetical protein